MRYVKSRYTREEREMAYRVFVTDSLQLSPQGKYITQRYADIVDGDNANDNRSAEEIAASVIESAGLKFAG